MRGNLPSPGPSVASVASVASGGSPELDKRNAGGRSGGDRATGTVLGADDADRRRGRRWGWLLRDLFGFFLGGVRIVHRFLLSWSFCCLGRQGRPRPVPGRPPDGLGSIAVDMQVEDLVRGIGGHALIGADPGPVARFLGEELLEVHLVGIVRKVLTPESGLVDLQAGVDGVLRRHAIHQEQPGTLPGPPDNLGLGLRSSLHRMGDGVMAYTGGGGSFHAAP